MKSDKKKATTVRHSKPSSGVRLRKKEARRREAEELHAQRVAALEERAAAGDLSAMRALAPRAARRRVHLSVDQLQQLAQRAALRASMKPRANVLNLIKA